MFNIYGFLQVWEKLWRVGILVLMVMTEIFVLTELLLHFSYCLVFFGWHLCMILRYASWWKEKTYHPTINGVCDWILTVYYSTFLFASFFGFLASCLKYHVCVADTGVKGMVKMYHRIHGWCMMLNWLKYTDWLASLLVVLSDLSVYFTLIMSFFVKSTKIWGYLNKLLAGVLFFVHSFLGWN